MKLRALSDGRLRAHIEDGDDYMLTDDNGVDVDLSAHQVERIVRWALKKAPGFGLKVLRDIGVPMQKVRECPAFKHAKDNDDETLNKMFRDHSTPEMLQELAARMADDDGQDVLREAAGIGLSLNFNPVWRRS